MLKYLLGYKMVSLSYAGLIDSNDLIIWLLVQITLGVAWLHRVYKGLRYLIRGINFHIKYIFK